MRITLLTGAGISAESGIRTFRDTGGLWETHSLHEVATPEAFVRDPALVHRFYSARRAALAGVAPNAAHRALARLQRARPDTTLVTQNVDDLHERAGARPIHMHGELLSMLCGACGHRWAESGPTTPETSCPACEARLPASDPLRVPRPDVVWFGEMPYHMERIERAVAEADLFVSIGTSGEVYPAAGFVALAKAAGARTLEINLEPSKSARLFDAARMGRATREVPKWVEEVLG